MYGLSIYIYMLNLRFAQTTFWFSHGRSKTKIAVIKTHLKSQQILKVERERKCLIKNIIYSIFSKYN